MERERRLIDACDNARYIICFVLMMMMTTTMMTTVMMKKKEKMVSGAPTPRSERVTTTELRALEPVGREREPGMLWSLSPPPIVETARVTVRGR